MGNTYNRVYIWCCKYGENRYCERCANKWWCASKHTGLLNSCLGKCYVLPYLVVPLISARVTLISTRVSAHCQAILLSVIHMIQLKYSCGKCNTIITTTCKKGSFGGRIIGMMISVIIIVATDTLVLIHFYVLVSRRTSQTRLLSFAPSAGRPFPTSTWAAINSKLTRSPMPLYIQVYHRVEYCTLAIYHWPRPIID